MPKKKGKAPQPKLTEQQHVDAIAMAAIDYVICREDVYNAALEPHDDDPERYVSYPEKKRYAALLAAVKAYEDSIP